MASCPQVPSAALDRSILAQPHHLYSLPQSQFCQRQSCSLKNDIHNQSQALAVRSFQAKLSSKAAGTITHIDNKVPVLALSDFPTKLCTKLPARVIHSFPTDCSNQKGTRRNFSRKFPVVAIGSLRSGENDRCAPVLDDVPHFSNWLPNLETYLSPLSQNYGHAAAKEYFVDPDDVLSRNVVFNLSNPEDGVFFRRAGPREKIYFTPEEVRACIVTCGGLCPGLNTVIREIVYGLWNQYGVHDIMGIEGGYRGFYARNTVPLNPKIVNDIHKRGGTILGTSRGGHNTEKIVSSIEDRGINQVYIIGGDGTQKGAAAIFEEIKRRGLKVAVAGIPKTIDNDIDVIDRSFGFDTAVEEAQRAINAAHTEAESTQNGIGLVKLMGRYSGYIAMYATLASRDVDCCLIPEVPFYLDGKDGLYKFVEKCLQENGHMVIVVAEGAGQELLVESMGVSENRDASGNCQLLDVGHWLAQKMKDHFITTRKEVLNLKYIDPTYMIRAVPSNAADNIYCTLLAQSAIHGLMAGYTGFTVGPVNGRHAYIPIARITEKQRRVNVTDRMWARLLSSTGQPHFLKNEKITGNEQDQKVIELVREGLVTSIF